MKLFVIGCGQCGGRIADEFCRINVKARVQRGIDIVTGIIAVNTDIADLSGLSFIRRDYQHRIVIGGQRTSGHGVGKINELGAEVARDDGDKVLEAISTSPQFAETDAFLLIGGCGGGTGSGAIPVLTQQLKDRYPEKPVYALIVLPFKHEELTEERTVYNAATCLKSVYLVADAVLLVDNQRYVRKNLSLRRNLFRINSSIVEPFYNLLCSGEEKRPEFIGSKILDAGDIIQTLTGWTVIGHGKAPIPRINFPFNIKGDFVDKVKEAQRGVKAINEAIGELSLRCNPKDARKALYFVSAPHHEMNVELMNELGTILKRLAPDAIIGSGDYPREKHVLNVTVILSELAYVGKIMDYFSRVILYLATKKRGAERPQRGIEEAFRDIPSLL